MHPKDEEGMTNNVESDQTNQEQSDLSTLFAKIWLFKCSGYHSICLLLFFHYTFISEDDIRQGLVYECISPLLIIMAASCIVLQAFLCL